MRNDTRVHACTVHRGGRQFAIETRAAIYTLAEKECMHIAVLAKLLCHSILCARSSCMCFVCLRVVCYHDLACGSLCGCPVSRPMAQSAGVVRVDVCA